MELSYKTSCIIVWIERRKIFFTIIICATPTRRGSKIEDFWERRFSLEMIVMFNPVEYVKRKTKAIIHKQCYHENQRTQSILSFLSPPSIVKKNIICSRMIHHKLKATEVQIFNTMVIIVKKRKLSTIPIVNQRGLCI